MEDLAAKDLVDFMLTRANKSRYRASLDMGRRGQYLDAVKRKGGSLGLEVSSELAEVCGCDLLIADHKSGEILARIVPRDSDTDSTESTTGKG